MSEIKKLTNKDWVSLYPHLADFEDKVIFVSHEDLENIKNKKRVPVYNNIIFLDLYKKLLSDKEYFDRLLADFENETNFFKIVSIDDGKIKESINFTKIELINNFQLLMDTNHILLDEEQYHHFSILKKYTAEDYHFNKHINDVFKVTIDGVQCEIPVIDIYLALKIAEERLSPDGVFQILHTEDHSKNLSSQQFYYGICEYFKKYRPLEDINLPYDMISRLWKIKNYQIVDCESINTFLKTEDTKFKYINIEPTLKKEILDGMSQDFNELEKAIFIYIKMCKIFTYDEEYFVSTQDLLVEDKHSKLSYVDSLNSIDNKLVCFEFNIIFSKLLDELGLKFKSDYHSIEPEDYGLTHANLSFRYKKFLLCVDSVSAVLSSDLSNAKLNDSLCGFDCINKNNETKNEFNEILDKVYEYIISLEKANEKQVGSFDELVDEYMSLTKTDDQISLSEKIQIMIELLDSTNLIGVDAFTYLIRLKKMLISESEEKKFRLSIIKDSVNVKDNMLAQGSAVLYVNENEQVTYYLYFPGKKLKIINKEELQELFDKGMFEYIYPSDPRLPGIEEKEEDKNVR